MQRFYAFLQADFFAENDTILTKRGVKWQKWAKEIQKTYQSYWQTRN